MATYKIAVPNKNFDGWRCGVKFNNGAGITTNRGVVEDLLRMGYALVETIPDENDHHPMLDDAAMKEKVVRLAPRKSQRKPPSSSSGSGQDA